MIEIDGTLIAKKRLIGELVGGYYYYKFPVRLCRGKHKMYVKSKEEHVKYVFKFEIGYIKKYGELTYFTNEAKGEKTKKGNYTFWIYNGKGEGYYE